MWRFSCCTGGKFLASVFGLRGVNVEFWCVVRVPKYSAVTLDKWFDSDIPFQTVQVVKYFLNRTVMVLDMLDKAEVITKTA